MSNHLAADPSIRSATIVPTLGLTLALFGFAALFTLPADPGWWGSSGQNIVRAEQVVTNNGVVTTNYIPNPTAVANQGELKAFTEAAVHQLNADLTNGGAGPSLSNLVYGWSQDYATNGYATNTSNPSRPFKPADYRAVNVGQLKYIASLLYDQLSSNGYTGLYPSWIVENTSTDTNAASIGQLKTVFNFDLDVAPNAVENVTAIPSNPGEVDLSWALPTVNAATSIIINYSTNGGQTWNTLTTINPTSTAYSATGLDPDLSYEFSVATSNNNPSTGQPQTGNSPPPTPSTNAPPSPRYAVIDLGTSFFPLAINSSGTVVGNTASFQPYGYTFQLVPTGNGEVWSSGTLSPLAQSLSMAVQAIGLNDSNQVFGQAYFNYARPSFASNTLPSSVVEQHACYWPTTNGSPVDLDTQQNLPDAHNQFYAIGHNGASEYLSSAWGGNANGFYGASIPYDSSYGATFSTTGIPAVVYSADNLSNEGTGPDSFVTCVSANHWCGYTVIGNSGFLIDGQFISVNSPAAAFACGINTNGFAVGGEASQSSQASYAPYFIQGGTPTPLPGSGIATAVNNYAIITAGNPPVPNPAPQIVGVDSTSTNAVLWDQTMLNGTNTVNSTYIPKPLSQLVPKNGTNAIWQVSTAGGINDSGAIVGTANYVGTNSAIPAGQHGVMLLPCQLRLLNGAQSGSDGMDFNGTRPTTISATAAYNTQATYDIGTTTHGNAGIDVIGNDLPLGVGRPGLSGQAYTYSILMLAKVSPSTATNITYAWGRVYQDQSVTIAHTATNTWYVNVVGTPTGVPTPELDTGSSNFTTTTPSTNNNVVTFYDNPAMVISDFTSGAPNTNDFAYEKTDFTYFLTNSIGSASAVAQQHVGQILLAKRKGTSGVIANDWTGITNYMSTANVPNCTTVSTNEIRNIVGGTNAIIFDPSVPASP